MQRNRRFGTPARLAMGLVPIGLTVSLLALSGCATTSPSAATNRDVRTNEARQAQDLVEKSRMTLNDFLSDAQMGDPVRSLLKRARAVVIFPQVLKGAFIVGASGGNGVALARDAENRWSSPAFYTLGEASFGFQAGGEASEVLLVALTDRGLRALQSTSAKLGADVGLAAGPVGLGAAAATENLSADIVSYVRNKGLYAGASLSGAVLAVRDGLNQSYYGRAATPTDILISHAVTNRQSAGLVGELRRIAS